MSTYNYHFVVHTGDQAGAGTDSNIFVQLIGERGITNEVRLNQYVKGNAFERNKIDDFTAIFNKDVGDVYQIILRSDTKYPGSNWLLDYIYIDGEQECDTSEFQIAQWINDQKSKTFDVTGGYKYTADVKKAKPKEEIGAPYYVNNPSPDYYDFPVKVHEEFYVSFEYSETDITSVATKASVQVDRKFIQASLELFLEKSIESKTNYTWGQKFTKESTHKFPVPPFTKNKKIYSVWTTMIQPVDVRLGDSQFTAHEKEERTFSGFKDLDTGEWLYRVDDPERELEDA